MASIVPYPGGGGGGLGTRSPLEAVSALKEKNEILYDIASIYGIAHNIRYLDLPERPPKYNKDIEILFCVEYYTTCNIYAQLGFYFDIL